MFIAEQYKEEILEKFQFSERRSFCQIATVAKDNDHVLPKMRTVLMYHEIERDAFRFTCSTQTHKWQELLETPKLSGVYLDHDKWIQYRFEANVVLIDNKDTNEETLYASSWQQLRPDLRHVLWQEYLTEKQDYDIETIFPCHGAVLIFPYYWDIFQLGLDDFANSQRRQCILKNDEWLTYENTPRIVPHDLSKNR